MYKNISENFFYEPHTLDGAFGTLAIEWGDLPIGYSSERLSIEDPELVKKIHSAYAEAGADIICANTFGANPLKGGDWKSRICAAVKLAREAAPHSYIALDVGCSGKLIGDGGFAFDDAVAAYAEYYAATKDYDLILIETMTDLKELRAALIAAKDTGKPYICSMSFEETGYTFFGCSLESFAVTAIALGASAVGINCSLGSRKVKPLAEKLRKISSVPVFIKPNAGMPSLVGSRTVYDENAETFTEAMREIAGYGIAMLGGCCGTTPEYIRKISRIERSYKVGSSCGGKLCCAVKCIATGDKTLTVGERINPTGKPALKRALADGDIDKVVELGLSQAETGAELLDVNVGLNGIDEKETMRRSVNALASVGLPLVIDSSKPAVIESALKNYDGKALVNSVNGTEESLSTVLPIAVKYGAAIVGLCLDDNGIPETAEGRISIAKRIIERAVSLGIDRKDIYIDTLTMAEGSLRGNAMATVNALKQISDMGVNSVLGISNISFGMPDREDINAAFYGMCKDAGLTLAIINPSLVGLRGSVAAYRFLSGEKGAAEEYIEFKNKTIDVAEKSAVVSQENTDPKDLKSAVLKGLVSTAENAARILLKTEPPLSVAEKYIIPALDEVGENYGAGRSFLPQLIASADAAKAAMDVLAEKFENISESDKRFVLCTVKGDIHDIGKNIVKAVVRNYGYRVIDLGRDVSPEEVLAAVKKHYPCVLGLSALMTTTAENMAETIALVHSEFPSLKVLVGGAVLTESYAESIGGIYCRDANDTVRQLKILFE